MPPIPRPQDIKSLKLFGGDEKLRLYAAIAAVIAALAVVMAALQAPQRSAVGNCLGIALSSYRDSCIGALAYSTSNASLCGRMSTSEGSDLCLLNVSLENNNASSCGGISSQRTKDLCVYSIANRTNAPGLCATLDSVTRDQCVTQLASKLREPGLCANASGSYAASVCTSAAELSIAYATSNSLLCGLVGNSTDPSTVSNITAYPDAYASSSSQGNYLSGRGIESPFNFVQFLPNVTYSARDMCYMYISYTTGDQAYCASIPNATLSSVCYETTPSSPSANSSAASNSLGIYLNGTSLNYTLISKEMCTNSSLSTQDCNNLVLLYEALQTKNTSICASLPDLVSFTCYSSLASKYSNSSYCSYITNASLNSACVQNVYYNSS